MVMDTNSHKEILASPSLPSKRRCKSTGNGRRKRRHAESGQMACSKNFDPSSWPKSEQVQCKSAFYIANKLEVAVDAAYAGATFWCAPLPNSLPIPSFCKEG
ncbi:hypothetical protein AAC387_Pa04g1135 [Persea americana]